MYLVPTADVLRPANQLIIAKAGTILEDQRIDVLAEIGIDNIPGVYCLTYEAACHERTVVLDMQAEATYIQWQAEHSSIDVDAQFI